MGISMKDVPTEVRITGLARLSDDEWKARHGALLADVKAHRTDADTSALLDVVHKVGALSGTAVAGEADRLREVATTVSKRAESAVADVVRTLFLNLTDAKTAGVARLTQAEVARALGCDQSRVSRHLARVKVQRVTAALKARGLEADSEAVADKVRTVSGFREAMAEAATTESVPEWAHKAPTDDTPATDSDAVALLKAAQAVLTRTGEIVLTDGNREEIRRAHVALQSAARNLSSMLAAGADKADKTA